MQKILNLLKFLNDTDWTDYIPKQYFKDNWNDKNF
jgi:hypothetical protein